jgi:hypothetical protein
MKLDFWTDFFKKCKISRFVKISPVGKEFFHADRQKNGQT